METTLWKSPLFVFIFVAIVVTNVSLLFPQNLGKYQKVAGWPLVMYKIEYQLVADIDPAGRLIHGITAATRQMMWERAFLNILIWTLLLHGAWVFHRKVEKTGTPEGNSA